MLFNSLEYLVFLFGVFIFFWATARARLLRVLLLLVASWIFYMSWNATFIVLIVGSTLLDYWVGLRLHAARTRRARRVYLALSLVGNLGALGVFKYADFAIEVVSKGLSVAGYEVHPPYLGLILPVGISFYTFQTLSYTIDVYRGRLQPTESFLEFATFVAFFPQLVAGPIVRASELLPQLHRRPMLDADLAGDGMFLILRGLTKKVVVADYLASNFIDRVWDDPGAWSSAEVWLATAAYSWQIYYDFSGYTDIARGSAKLFGFELPVNFRRPFQATSPADFWNRWHLTLSRWIRDYVYIPLGGSRRGRGRKYVNIFVAFLITGLWHGAGWTFLCFALWHATTVTATHVLRDITGKSDADACGAGRVLLVLFSNLLFAFHWPMFRSRDADNMLAMYHRMFAWDWGAWRVPAGVWWVLLGAAAWHMTPQAWMDGIRRGMVRLPAPAQAALILTVTVVIVWVGRGQAAPFVYFQF